MTGALIAGAALGALLFVAGGYVAVIAIAECVRRAIGRGLGW